MSSASQIIWKMLKILLLIAACVWCLATIIFGGLDALITGLLSSLGLGWLYQSMVFGPILVRRWPWLLQLVLLTAGACLALHVFMVWLRHRVAQSGSGSPSWPWRWRHTVYVFGMILVLIGGACATIGFAHQAAWLGRTPWIVEKGRSYSKKINRARQVMIMLKLYASDHDGRYPRHLDVLRGLETEASDQVDKLFSVDLGDGVSLPWVYLPGLHDGAPGNLPVLIAPEPLSPGKYIVATNDGTARVTHKDSPLLPMLKAWMEYVGAKELPLGLEIDDPAAKP